MPSRSIFDDDAFGFDPATIGPMDNVRSGQISGQGVPDTDQLRRGGAGCTNPGMGCNRGEYTVRGGDGYLRRGYDDGRWWMK